MTITRREFEELRRDLARARQELAQRPLFGGGGGAAAPDLRIIVMDGNTLATGQDGINFSSSAITDIPIAYDPTAPVSAIDGIGRGQLFKDGSFVGYVLCCNDGTGGTTIDFDLLGGSDSQDVCSVATTKSVTVAGDPLTTVDVYILKSLIG